MMPTSLPGYRIYEYQLVLLPNDALRHRILQAKQEFAERYRLPFHAGGRPFIPLVQFQQYELMEERLLHRIGMVAMSQPPFKVELRDFGSFPSHTVFIQVASRLPVQQLVRTLRTEAQRLMKLNEDSKPHFMTEPHIPLGTRLKPWQYEKSWLEYSQRSFSGRFIADGMLLLKRRQGDSAWQVAKRFEFMNLPVLTRQGELFG